MDFWFVNIKYSEPLAVLAITICDLAVKGLRRGNIRPQHVSSRWFHLQYIWLTCCPCVHFFISCFSLHSSSEKSLPWRTAGTTTQSKQRKAIVLPSTSCFLSFATSVPSDRTWRCLHWVCLGNRKYYPSPHLFLVTVPKIGRVLQSVHHLSNIYFRAINRRCFFTVTQSARLEHKKNEIFSYFRQTFAMNEVCWHWERFYEFPVWSQLTPMFVVTVQWLYRFMSLLNDSYRSSH